MAETEETSCSFSLSCLCWPHFSTTTAVVATIFVVGGGDDGGGGAGNRVEGLLPASQYVQSFTAGITQYFQHFDLLQSESPNCVYH